MPKKDCRHDYRKVAEFGIYIKKQCLKCKHIKYFFKKGT